MLELAVILDELVDSGSLTCVRPSSAAGNEVVLVPTLERGTVRLASPQLQQRFVYAASWDGPGALRFFSTEEMTSIWLPENDVYSLVRDRREAWDGALMASLPAGRVSLIAASKFDGDEVYLLWRDDGEPAVVSYFGHSEVEFEDLRAFMLGFI